jgi:hypothetical protein
MMERRKNEKEPRKMGFVDAVNEDAFMNDSEHL